jgi:DNA-directed RNA polymerase specialized sigma24 family protein
VFLTVVRRLHQCRASEAAWLWAVVRSELARHWRDGLRRHRPVNDGIVSGDDPPAARAERNEAVTGNNASLALFLWNRQLKDSEDMLPQTASTRKHGTGRSHAKIIL